MNESTPPENPPRNTSKDRLERLAASGQNKGDYNPYYSVFIKWMRLALPLAALAIAALVFAWQSFDDPGVITAQNTDKDAPKTIGKNELLNPRFESTDEKNQPYTITAKRAVQGQVNEDLIVLEEPVADIKLTSGNWVAIKAVQGAFTQNNQQLLLRGDVTMLHDRGYEMTTEQLHIDIENKTSWTDTDVNAHGPEGTLSAKGLKGDAISSHIVFTGPAKLVLTRTKTEDGIGDLWP